MAGDAFRRTLRIPLPESDDDIDNLLIAHMERLEKESPFRMQEWIRGALRQAVVSEKLSLAFGNKVRFNEIISMAAKSMETSN